MIKNTPLAAKVAAVNLAHSYANEMAPILRAAFEPLIGQKIEKVDGTLLKKIAELVPEFPKRDGLHNTYRHTSDYSLAWCIKACVASPSGDAGMHHAHYHEVTLYIGDMHDGVLTKLTKPYTYKADHTVKDVEKARETYRNAKKAADDAHSALNGFGEYDR